MNWNWLFLLMTCSVMYGSYSSLVTLSQVDGKILYDSSQAVFINELFKILISVVMLVLSGGDWTFSISEGLPYTISGFCYFINNNLSFFILSYMDPASFSILSNLKVLTTTLLYRLIMKRQLKTNQIASLMILCAASCVHSYGSVVDGRSDVGIRVTLPGVLMLLGGILLTSLASVSTEYFMKKEFKMSMFKQNIYLYIVGLLFNGSMAAVRLIGHTDRYFLRDFNVFTWLAILNTTLQGFCVSVVMKYGSNITRLILQCSSLLVSTCLSLLIFNIKLTAYFSTACVLILIALYLYNRATVTQPANAHQSPYGSNGHNPPPTKP